MRRNVDHGAHHFTPPLYTQRLHFVTKILKTHSIQSVLDVGCNEAQLLHFIVMSSGKENSPRRYAGIDASRAALERASASAPTSLCPSELLHSCEASFLHGDVSESPMHLTAESAQLLEHNFELIACTEVIEHIPKSRLGSFLHTLFDNLANLCGSRIVAVTTPNNDFNWRFGAAKGLRHEDHKFEFTHSQFVLLCVAINHYFGWSVDISSLGNGATQCAVFKRSDKVAQSWADSRSFEAFQQNLSMIFEGDLQDAVPTSLRVSEIGAVLSITHPMATIHGRNIWQRVRDACEQFAMRTAIKLTSSSARLHVRDIMSSPELALNLAVSSLAIYSSLISLRQTLHHSPIGTPCSFGDISLRCRCSSWQIDASRLVDSTLGSFFDSKSDDDHFLVAETNPLFTAVIMLANLGYCRSAGSCVSVMFDKANNPHIVQFV